MAVLMRSSGVCGPGCEVEQCPVPVALEEFIEPLRESPRGLLVLVGAGEHPGPREDFAAGVSFALGGRGPDTEAARGGVELGFFLRQFLLQLALLPVFSQERNLRINRPPACTYLRCVLLDL